MRCSKCGFYTFDYLSACNKCGADMTGIREDLGLLDVKPAVPFFLKVLLPDAEEDEAAVVKAGVLLKQAEDITELDMGGPELHLPDVEDLTIDLLDEGDESAAPAAAVSVAETAPAVSLDEIPEITLEEPPRQDAAPVSLPEMDFENAGKIAKELEPPPDAEGELTLDLSEVDIDHILGELEEDHEEEETLSVKGATAPDLAFEPLGEVDGMTLELSEDEIAELTSELEEPELEIEDKLDMEAAAAQELEVGEEDLLLELNLDDELSLGEELDSDAEEKAARSAEAKHKSVSPGPGGQGEEDLALEDLSDEELDKLFGDK